MKLRPYIGSKDFDTISRWVLDERINAMWSANLIHYPMEQVNFDSVMNENKEKYFDSSFVATTNDGELLGFFCYSINENTNEGMLKFILVAPQQRGKGYGKEMIQLALKYAFEITKVDAVHLNVFLENIFARKCYEKIGFKDRRIDEKVFVYKDEIWSRCNMVLKKDIGVI